MLKTNAGTTRISNRAHLTGRAYPRERRNYVDCVPRRSVFPGKLTLSMGSPSAIPSTSICSKGDGVHETGPNNRNKLAQGKFPAVFFIQRLETAGRHWLQISED